MKKPEGFGDEKLTTNYQLPTTNHQPKRDISSLRADFAAWYAAFPRHVGKGDAEKAYLKARKAGAAAGDLLAGIERYRAGKPEYADWCHPATWLNRQRWLDDYSAIPSLPGGADGPKGPPPRPDELWPEAQGPRQ